MAKLLEALPAAHLALGFGAVDGLQVGVEGSGLVQGARLRRGWSQAIPGLVSREPRGPMRCELA